MNSASGTQGIAGPMAESEEEKGQTGAERISATNTNGLRRCRYRGRDGMHRWVGLGVIANNLVTIARFAGHRAAA
jgi:IS5 family transposase